jgi:multiple sugar transport system substrate-binding protein
MTDSESVVRWSWWRKLWVTAAVCFGAAVFAVASALLVQGVPWGWGLKSVLVWIVIGMLLVLTGIAVDLLPRLIAAIWRRPSHATSPGRASIDRALSAIFRWRTVIGVALVTVVIVGFGWVIRPESTTLEPGPLVVMTAFGNSPSDPRTMLIEQWNQQHPDSQVQLEYVPGATDQQRARMVSDAKAGGENAADIYVLDIVWMAEFVDRGYLREFPAEGLDTSDFLPKVLDTGRRNDALWALPFNTDAGLIFYRSDVAGAGQLSGWQDYFGDKAKELLAKAKIADPAIEAANAAQLAEEEILFITALEAIWAAGGEVVAKNGQLLLTPDGSKADFNQAALNGIQSLAAGSKDSAIVLTKDDEARKSAEGEAIRAFTDGRTIYMRNWPVARDQIGQRRGYNISSPPSPSVLGGQNLAISAHSSKPRAAQALIHFLTSPSSELILSEIGGFAPTRHSAYANAKRPYAQEILTAVNNARLRPVTPCYTELSQEFRKGIARALNNGGRLEEEFARNLARVWRCESQS